MRAGVAFEASGRPPRVPDRARALGDVTARLRRAGVPSPERDAEWLLLHVLGVSRASLWAEPTVALTAAETGALESLVDRRERREPLQRILASIPFHDATLAIEPGVFVPRPETEALVDAVLVELGSAAGSRLGRLLDWGTGGGAIAIALLRALPAWTGVAADRSPAALALAARNAERNGVGPRLRLVEADFSRPAGSRGVPTSPPASFDLVVSNPPYVRRGDIEGLMPEVRGHDPREALDGGPDGLDAYRSLARGLRAWLKPGGHLAVEIGSDQADDVLRLFGADVVDARILPDWAGMPRILMGTMRGGEP